MAEPPEESSTSRPASRPILRHPPTASVRQIQSFHPNVIVFRVEDSVIPSSKKALKHINYKDEKSGKIYRWEVEHIIGESDGKILSRVPDFGWSYHENMGFEMITIFGEPLSTSPTSNNRSSFSRDRDPGYGPVRASGPEGQGLEVVHYNRSTGQIGAAEKSDELGSRVQLSPEQTISGQNTELLIMVTSATASASTHNASYPAYQARYTFNGQDASIRSQVFDSFDLIAGLNPLFIKNFAEIINFTQFAPHNPARISHRAGSSCQNCGTMRPLRLPLRLGNWRHITPWELELAGRLHRQSRIFGAYSSAAWSLAIPVLPEAGMNQDGDNMRWMEYSGKRQHETSYGFMAVSLNSSTAIYQTRAVTQCPDCRITLRVCHIGADFRHSDANALHFTEESQANAPAKYKGSWQGETISDEYGNAEAREAASEKEKGAIGGRKGTASEYFSANGGASCAFDGVDMPDYGKFGNSGNGANNSHAGFGTHGNLPGNMRFDWGNGRQSGDFGTEGGESGQGGRLGKHRGSNAYYFKPIQDISHSPASIEFPSGRQRSQTENAGKFDIAAPTDARQASGNSPENKQHGRASIRHDRGNQFNGTAPATSCSSRQSAAAGNWQNENRNAASDNWKIDAQYSNGNPPAVVSLAGTASPSACNAYAAPLQQAAFFRQASLGQARAPAFSPAQSAADPIAPSNCESATNFDAQLEIRAQAQSRATAQMLQMPHAAQTAALPSKRLKPVIPKKGKIKGLILDLDGVLVNSEPLHYRAFQEVVAPFGIKIDRNYYYQNYIGTGARHIFTDLLARHGINADVGPLMDEHLRLVVAHIRKGGISPMPGAIKLVRLAGAKGAKAAVASGSPRQVVESELGAIGLGSLPSITFNDVTHKKPHPESFLKAAEKIGEAPSSCLVVEDSKSGVLAALNARMPCLLVSGNAPPSSKALASKHSKSLASKKLLAWLLGLFANGKKGKKPWQYCPPRDKSGIKIFPANTERV